MIDKTKLNIAGDIAYEGITLNNVPSCVKEAYDKYWNLVISEYIKNPLEANYYVRYLKVGMFLGKDNSKKLRYLLEKQGVEKVFDFFEYLSITKHDLEEFIRIECDKGESPFILTRRKSK